MSTLNIAGKASLFLFLSFIVIISVVPISWVFLSSFKTTLEINSSAFALPAHFSFDNYTRAFSVAPIAKFYLNSIIISTVSTVLTLLILGMAAYVIARFTFRGKSFLVMMFSFSLLLPATALIMPIYLTMDRIGLYNTLAGLILVYTGFGIPITLYILKSYFLTIPKELDESACMDGAGFLRTFLQIVMPVARPGFSTAAILQFLLCWNEFQFALTLTTGNKARTLPMAFNYFKSMFATDYGAIFAAMVSIIIPSIAVFIMLQEQVVSGLASGSVKG